MLLSSLFARASSLPHKVEVFYDSDIKGVEEVVIEGVDLKYFMLDKGDKLTSSLDDILPTDLKSAAKFMNEYSNSPEGKTKIRAIVDGYQGVGRAYGVGVKKLPAIVFDEEYVVYGTTNVKDALKLWKELKGKAHE